MILPLGSVLARRRCVAVLFNNAQGFKLGLQQSASTVSVRCHSLPVAMPVHSMHLSACVEIWLIPPAIVTITAVAPQLVLSYPFFSTRNSNCRRCKALWLQRCRCHGACEAGMPFIFYCACAWPGMRTERPGRRVVLVPIAAIAGGDISPAMLP